MIEIRHVTSGEVLLRREGESLAGASLRKRILMFASMRGPDLRSADLTGAELAKTDFWGNGLPRGTP